MADRGDTHYSLPRANVVFMAISVVLFGSAIWMVVDDWNRDWKQHQRNFQKLELEQAQERLAAIETPEFVAERDELRARIVELNDSLKNNDEYQDLQNEVADLEGKYYKTNSNFKIAKAVYNWERYRMREAFGEANIDDGEGAEPSLGDLERDELQSAYEELLSSQKIVEAAEAELNEARARLAGMEADRDQAEGQLKELMREHELVAAKILSVGPGVFKTLRDAPGLDFVAPTIKVRKQVLPHLRKDYNFLTVQRVDMCASCHAGIDTPGFENPVIDGKEQPVLASHPRLDLFLSPSSPHPIDSFGCTVCHEGAAETLEFSRAVHTPEDHDEQHDWEKKHNWHHWHLWEWPMLPTKYTEAGCYGCHQQGDTLESIRVDAPKLTKGLDLIDRYGCYSCHKIDGWRNERKSGPSLRTIKDKISPEFTRAWIANPHDYREKSRMPQIYLLENAVSQEWDKTAIAAVQSYLWAVSEPSDVEPIPNEFADNIDAERGKELFQSVGCTACHVTPDTGDHEYSDYGPDLDGIGSKLSTEWMYNWIMDPAAWWPETRMPDMRLEPQQAADIAAYLKTLTKDGWTPEEVESLPQELEDQAKAFLGRRYSGTESERIISEWRAEGGEEKVMVEVGKQWVTNNGCYSCHDIPGFESSQPIGAELTDWGNKNVHKLAFEMWDEAVPGHFEGARHISRHAFAELKLSNPRRFDRGLEVAPLDRLRMPNFKLSEDEIEAITTVVLGLKDNTRTILPDGLPQPDETQKALERGSYLARQKNCYGCHKFEMDRLAAKLEDEDGNFHDREFIGLVSLEDEDEEATYMRLWKTDPDLLIEEGSGVIGDVAELYWMENDEGDYEPWPVQEGIGGGIIEELSNFYVENGTVDEASEAFGLIPPILYREGEKVRAPWVAQFLKAPYSLRPWLDVRMPKFKLTDEEARALALYFPALSRQEWPSRYTRDLRATMEMTKEELAAETGVQVPKIAAIESGGRHSSNAFSKIHAWGDSQGFAYDPPPTIPFEEVRERSPEYLEEKDAEIPGYLQAAADVVGRKGVNCYACHIRDGVEPGGDKLSWGPDLGYSKERLRPDWIRAWVTDAQKIYPGTKMPTAFGLIADDPKVRALMEGHSPEVMIEAVRDFLMNSDRVQEDAEDTAMLETPNNSQEGQSGGQ